MDGYLRLIDTNLRRIVGAAYLGYPGYALAIHPTSGDIYAPYGAYLSVFHSGLGLRQRIYVGCTAEDLAFTKTADRLWASCPSSRKINILNPTTGGVAQSLSAEPNSRSIVFHPNGQIAYIANEGGTGTGSLSVVDIPQASTIRTLYADTRAGTSFGRIADYGDQYGALKIEDLAPPYGVRVQANASGGVSPAVINPCGTSQRYTYPAGSAGSIFCRSTRLEVEAEVVEVAFVTTGGAQGYAQVGAGNGLILKPPVFPFDPPFSIQAPETNQSPVVVEIDGEPLVLEPGATPPTFSDGDGIPDDLDNCPTLDNQDQMDANRDSFGDACVPLDVRIDENVSIAQPIVIGSGTSISRDSRIGSGAVIGEEASIEKTFTAGENLRIGDRARIEQGAKLGDNVSVGAEVNIDKGAVISHSVMIGDRTRMATGVQIGEASVIGADCSIGREVRIGKRVIIGGGAVVPSRAVVPDGTLLP
jgi:acetyltransferase-like isoleucine patch superfamily enzyme